MVTTEEFATSFGGKIHIAEVKKGGNASWAEKNGTKEDSIRLAWYNSNGRFDPFSSAELPLWVLQELLQEASKRDMFCKSELAEMIGQLTASIYRQS